MKKAFHTFLRNSGHTSFSPSMSLIRFSLRTISRNLSTSPSPRPLLDSFSRKHTYLRLSLTERCNLRCVYCMPSEGVQLTPAPHLLSNPELLRLSSLFVSRGVTRIRLTGGEPLLRKDIGQIVRDLGNLQPRPQISLTTNGIVLGRYLDDLVQAGLDGVNISLDTLVEPKFELITRRRGLGRVLDSIEMAVDRNVKTKVNVVVMKGVNEDEIGDFVALTRKLNVDVRFIEYMPFDGNRWRGGKFVSYAEMLESVAKEAGELERITTDKHDTSKYYRVKGGKGRVGFITSMSEHFCAGCNRLRITADGNLKVCLFGNEEVSLRDMMRQGGTDEQLTHVIDVALRNKKWSLGGHEDMFHLADSPNRSMIKIGG